VGLFLYDSEVEISGHVLASIRHEYNPNFRILHIELSEQMISYSFTVLGHRHAAMAAVLQNCWQESGKYHHAAGPIK
jgi:hypothetical protein